MKLEKKHKQSKHVRFPSVPSWLPSSLASLGVKSGMPGQTAWTDKHNALASSFLSRINNYKAGEDSVIAAAQKLVDGTKKLVPGLSAHMEDEIAALSAGKRESIRIRMESLLESLHAKTASADVQAFLNAVLEAASARDPRLDAQLTKAVNDLTSPGHKFPELFGRLIKVTDEWVDTFRTVDDTRYPTDCPVFALIRDRIAGAATGEEKFALVQLFDNLIDLPKDTTQTGLLIRASILDTLGPMIAPQIGDDFVEGLLSSGQLDRRFFHLQQHCETAHIDFKKFMNPAVDQALARRIDSVEQCQKMLGITAEPKDEWGDYLQKRLAGHYYKLRPQRGANAVWRFMQAVQGDDRIAKKVAFYGAGEIDGLHTLIKSNMSDNGLILAVVDTNELIDWIDQAVMDHPGAELIAIMGGLDNQIEANGYIFDVVKPTLRRRLEQHLAVEQYVRTLIVKGGDVEGATKALSNAGAFEKGAGLESLLVAAVGKLDAESFAVLRTRVPERGPGDKAPEQATRALARDLEAMLTSQLKI